MLEFIEAFILLLVIMDPPLSVSAFLSVARGKPKGKQRGIILKAVAVAAFVFFLFALGGNIVLMLLGVDINSFKAAGGIILVLLGVQLALGFPIGRESHDMSEMAVVIGTPLISGPATITTAIILAGQMGLAVTLVSGAAALAVILISLLLSVRINRIIGNSGIRVLSTMMGLVTIAWGIQFLLSGVMGFFAP